MPVTYSTPFSFTEKKANSPKTHTNTLNSVSKMMMESRERHRCKLCFRNFENGRAMGGHMRSHKMKFYAEKREFQSLYSSPSSSEESEEANAGFVDHDFDFPQDRESEAEAEEKEESSPPRRRKPVCRRSKRVRKSRIPDFDGLFLTKKSISETLSSISKISPEEQMAHCLIMLSRDKWTREEIMEFQQDEEEEQEESSEDSVWEKLMDSSDNRVKGKYKCEECDKLFRSYQALGGHRANHKKIKQPQIRHSAAARSEKLHQCPFCDRIFTSGQALGGHKRSHFINGGSISANIATAKQNSRIGEALNIDLNLPAPVDEDDSTLSDAEFVQSIRV